MANEDNAGTATLPVPRELDDLTKAQYDKWRLTGEIPAEGEVEAPEVKEKEKTAAEVVPAVTAPAPKPKGAGSLTYSELRAKVRAQEAELERLKANPAATKQAEVVEITPPKSKKVETAPRPKANDTDAAGKPKYATWEDYEDALLDWNTERTLAKVEESQAKRQTEAQVQQQNTKIEQGWRERVDKSRLQHPDFDDVALDPDGPGKLIGKGSVVDTWILESDHGAEILYHFGKNPEELRRYGNLTPVAAARELTKLEDKLAGTAPAKAATTLTQVPPPKTPRPTTQVGGRGTTTADEVTKAVADDDVRAYIDAQNRREIASKRR